MNGPRFTLITDGPSDGDMLIPILRWLLRIYCPSIGINIEYADPLRCRVIPKKLSQKISFALDNHPCDCLFVHRDAEKETPDVRRNEIRRTIESSHEGNLLTPICVVPVRMSEAWLLFDERAIRSASGNPNGRVQLELPRGAAVEKLPDPKHTLYEVIAAASELTGRRRKKFDSKAPSRLIAKRITDFSPLRELAAFQVLEDDVRRITKERGWDLPS